MEVPGRVFAGRKWFELGLRVGASLPSIIRGRSRYGDARYVRVLGCDGFRDERDRCRRRIVEIKVGRNCQESE